jgi:hypothetical protein
MHPLDVDFLIIGAQRTGTTWTWECLRRHPEIFIPRKEMHFWDKEIREIHPGGPYSHFAKYFFGKDESPITESDINAYRTRFKPAKGRLKGESTPSYSIISINGVKKIREVLPDVRIVYTVRNPVDRLWSSICLAARLNAEICKDRGKYHSFDQWPHAYKLVDSLLDDPEKPQDVLAQQLLDSSEFCMTMASLPPHVQRTDYKTSLERWISVFPKEQILVLDYNTLCADPDGYLKKICSHIGCKNAECRSVARSEPVSSPIPKGLLELLKNKWDDTIPVVEEFIEKEFDTQVDLS